MDEPSSPHRLTWLAQTKFHPPRLRGDVISRSRLLGDLHDALTSHALTLISAPAGYGKTTLLAEWVHTTSKLQTPNSKVQTPNSQAVDVGDLKFEVGSLDFSGVAWLSLDEDDNDPARFLAALIAALQRLHPACGATAQTLLTSLPNPGAEARRVIGALINDVLESLPDPFVLVLDDLHLIAEPSIYAALDYLLERLPSQMHLAVSARHDPPMALARLRARGELAELRLPELRFTDEEASQFLNDKLRLGLSPADLTTLQARAEGWPAGLR
ncbi:MAG: AAA family ATPase, partial [Chloroflexi bacterium]|nr:AAA family ATPase [Chloroflexota bacterium]